MPQVDEIKELDALVSLLDEPNDDMFVEIRERVVCYGMQAVPILEEAWANTMGEEDSDRIIKVIDDIRQNDLISCFKDWMSSSDSNLIESLILITRYFQPKFDEEYYINSFNKLFREIWLELNDNLTALEKIKVLNHVMFGVYGFQEEPNTTLKSDTFFLNKVFDYKKGNSISLGIIYASIAQKLSIPVFGVNLPNNFVLAYMDDFVELKLPGEYTEDEAVFYINAGNRGAVFTHNEITNYLSQVEVESKPKFFIPSSNKDVIRRMVNELILSFEKENNHSKTIVLRKLLAIL